MPSCAQPRLTVKRALVPLALGTAGERRGADKSTSGVNLVAVRVMLSDTDVDMSVACAPGNADMRMMQETTKSQKR